MNRWIRAARWLGIACVFGVNGSAFAEDHLIENRRDVLIIDDTEWGDTYVGKYTEGNRLKLIADFDVTDTSDLTLTSGNAFVGYAGASSNNTVEVSLSNSTWQASSLNIGATNNSGNSVVVKDHGNLVVSGGVNILGVGNTLTLGSAGSLDVGTTFNASMDGFIYETGNTLKVRGELSGLDQVESNRTVNLIGSEARWNFGSNLFAVGGLSNSNNVSFEDGASASISHATLGAGGNYNAMDLSGIDTELTVNNLVIGAAGTMTNQMFVSDGARTHVLDALTIAGTGNSLQVTNGGWLEVEMDFNANMSGFELQTGGGLEAHRNLFMDGISNGVNVVLNGTNALWNRTGLTLNIGSSTNDGNNSLVVENGAQALADQFQMTGENNKLTIIKGGFVQIGQIQIGETNSIDNTVLIADGGNLVLEGLGSYIHDENSLTLINGGRLTVKEDFGAAIGWNTNATFYWRDGGILECQGEAPVFSEYNINDQFVERGTLFLRDGQILMLNGSNAAWTAGADNLHIGDLSSGNALIVTNGALVDVATMTMGDFAEGGDRNQIFISGSNSTIQVAGDVEIGGRTLDGEWVDGGSDNVLLITDGGALNTGGSLTVGGSNNSIALKGTDLSVAGGMVFHGEGQQLLIGSGSILTNGGLFELTGSEAKIIVSGTNSVLSTHNGMNLNGDNLLVCVTNVGLLANGGDLNIAGSNNLVAVASGGIIFNAGGMSVTGAGHNQLFVTGEATELTAQGDVTLAGTDISIDLLDGAMLTNSGAF
ncbi:hypothetical protein P4B35_17200, partial [Pontiellaceae bacterium B12227]|nr:hypothetical protein [Pontiellaceae bacterium B12227]